MSKIKNENRIAGVYKITNKINNKSYIGESLDIYRRWDEHKDDLKRNKHYSTKLQLDYNTYGDESFTYEIIEIVNDDYGYFLQKIILIAYENIYMKKYSSVENGYNTENTIVKILNKEKTIFGDYENFNNERVIYVLKSVIKNIQKNNGVYVHYIKPNTKHKNNTIKIKKSANTTSSLSIPASIKECIVYFLANGYKLKCQTISDIYKKLREIEILYYDENKANLPNEQYINKYFYIKKYTLANGIKGKTTVVLKNGVEFLKNVLIENDLIEDIS